MGKTPKRTTRERAAEKGESEDPAAARAEPPASPALQATPAPDGKRSKKKQRAKDDAEAQGGVSAEGGKRRKMAGGGGERKDREGRKVSVHVARFVEHQPAAITAMAHDAGLQMLAVGRGSGDIQLWSTVAPRWHPIGVCVGSPSSQIRAVCWAGGRLFSASLDGRIVEWSLSSLAPVASEDSHGGSIWALASSRDGAFLAAACHDGAVRLFAVAEVARAPPHPPPSRARGHPSPSLSYERARTHTHTHTHTHTPSDTRAS